ncbi:MAG: DNA topoisomerase I [Spirochaetes bacterium]|nr:DNA topoisomerase I [Spirochaetota bacterium]
MHWKNLKHNGVAFPPPYEVKGLSVKINGEVISLKPLAEEMAWALCKKIGTVYVDDNVFIRNFLFDFFRQILNTDKEIKVSILSKTFDEKQARIHFHYALDEIKKDVVIDFDRIYLIQLKEKEALERLRQDPEKRKALTAERKIKREELKEQYGYAWVDGVQTEIASYVAEPAGVFMGRGQHPLRGRWKPEVKAEEVTLNLGEEAPVPEGNWKEIVHNHDATWLAMWKEKLTGKTKYVWLSDVSELKQKRDKSKYDNAATVGPKMEKVRNHILKGMKARDEKRRKIAMTCYLIDKLAMRVGDEKDQDEADTVGASTLRVEHITINQDRIVFDFIGKDFVQWHKELPVKEIPPEFLENLKIFVEGKNKKDLVFDGINSSRVNKFLQEAVPHLSAKVFRTFHATKIVNDYLKKHDAFKEEDSNEVKLFHARMANLKAAVECNHKRTVPKTWRQTLQKKKDRLKELKKKIPKTEKQKLKLLERIEKMKLQINLQEHTKEYNLNTSLKNYVDPRIFTAWAKYVGLDWTKIYPKTMQKKFIWTTKAKKKWK